MFFVVVIMLEFVGQVESLDEKIDISRKLPCLKNAACPDLDFSYLVLLNAL